MGKRAVVWLKFDDKEDIRKTDRVTDKNDPPYGQTPTSKMPRN